MSHTIMSLDQVVEFLSGKRALGGVDKTAVRQKLKNAPGSAKHVFRGSADMSFEVQRSGEGYVCRRR